MPKIIFTDTQLLHALAEEDRTLTLLNKAYTGLLHGHLSFDLLANPDRDMKALEWEIEWLKMSLAYKRDWQLNRAEGARFYSQRLPRGLFLPRGGVMCRRFNHSQVPKRLKRLVAEVKH